MTSMRAAAVAAASRGWAVFPCRPRDKRPACDQWERRAVSNPEQVARYWPSDRHNVGVACGPSGLVVVDLDTAAHGGQLPESWRAEPGVVDGLDVLGALADRAGQPWPTTYTVATPSGGRHLYYQAIRGREIRNSAGKIGPMIDVRGTGGYVVGAGSIVGSGGYEVLHDQIVELLPAWLAELAAPPRPAAPVVGPAATGSLYGRFRGVVEFVLTSEPRTRNGRLYWAACRAAEMVSEGKIDAVTAECVLLEAALEAGLRGGESEARRTIASGLRTA